MINLVFWHFNPVSNQHKFIHGSKLCGSQVIFYPCNIFLVLNDVLPIKFDRLPNIGDIEQSLFVLIIRDASI